MAPSMSSSPAVTRPEGSFGNVHLMLGRKDIAEDTWRSKLPLVLEDIHEVGISVGGIVSGEHGIGFEKRSYFTTILDENLVGLVKRVKAAFDPNSILNLGDIFDCD